MSLLTSRLIFLILTTKLTSIFITNNAVTNCCQLNPAKTSYQNLSLLNMALLQFNSFSSFSVLSTSQQQAYLSPSSIKTHQQNNSLFSFSATNTKDGLFSLSTHPRKFLCKPPQGKYVREDYLVVCSKQLSFSF